MRKAMPHGPVSLMRTVIERPFFGLVTVSVVPSGQVRAAAVLPFGSKRSPLAVRWPDDSGSPALPVPRSSRTA